MGKPRRLAVATGIVGASVGRQRAARQAKLFEATGWARNAGWRPPRARGPPYREPRQLLLRECGVENSK